MTKKLTHLDQSGEIQMVNVGSKPVSERTAKASGEIKMHAQTLAIIKAGELKKGDLFSTAKIAGIMAAKRTAELIPLCHPLMLSYISVELEFDDDLPGILIESEVSVSEKTGVEMEALTAVSVAALTVYDMAKAVDKSMRIQNIHLVEKRGGTSGDVFNG